jgi:hypothetical protein
MKGDFTVFQKTKLLRGLKDSPESVDKDRETEENSAASEAALKA